jgi:hypothetical protein
MTRPCGRGLLRIASRRRADGHRRVPGRVGALDMMMVAALAAEGSAAIPCTNCSSSVAFGAVHAPAATRSTRPSFLRPTESSIGAPGYPCRRSRRRVRSHEFLDDLAVCILDLDQGEARGDCLSNVDNERAPMRISLHAPESSAARRAALAIAAFHVRRSADRLRARAGYKGRGNRWGRSPLPASKTGGMVSCCQALPKTEQGNRRSTSAGAQEVARI